MVIESVGRSKAENEAKEEEEEEQENRGHAGKYLQLHPGLAST